MGDIPHMSGNMTAELRLIEVKGDEMHPYPYLNYRIVDLYFPNAHRCHGGHISPTSLRESNDNLNFPPAGTARNRKAKGQRALVFFV